ncbi:MAG: TRAP transporter substrate-binding protein DctP [Xanthomonadales bacterium]|nr:TRAP transporter substrate-binding protein DctP [Xanthomonadales bacterium]
MNRNRLIHLLAALSVVLLPLTAAGQTLKIATVAPEGSSWMKDMRAGAEVITRHTDGRVKFKFYGGGVQGNDKQVQRKMRTGQLHGGAFTSGGLNKFQADADLFALPLLFGSIEEAKHVRSELEHELRDRLEEAGYVNFGFAAAGFAYMMSNRPMRALSDMDGQKVWIPEGDPAGFAALRALGVAPVVMPITDVMTGLQTDLLDSVSVPPVGAVVFQWFTRLKYVTDVPVAYVYAALLIDKQAFDRLSEDDQRVVREVMEGIYRKFDQNGVKENRQAMQALMENGLEMVEPQATEIAEWRDIVLQSHRDLARNGVFDSGLLDRIDSLITDYRNGGATGAQ